MKVSEILAELRGVEGLVTAVNRDLDDAHGALDEFKAMLVDAISCEHADILEAAREACAIDFLCGDTLIRVSKHGDLWNVHHFTPFLVD